MPDLTFCVGTSAWQYRAAAILRICVPVGLFGSPISVPFTAAAASQTDWAYVLWNWLFGTVGGILNDIIFILADEMFLEQRRYFVSPGAGWYWALLTSIMVTGKVWRGSFVS